MGYRISIPPINIIYSETKILPLAGRFKFLSYKFLLRCIAKEDYLTNLEDISALAGHYAYENNFEPMLVSSFEIVSPYANLL